MMKYDTIHQFILRMKDELRIWKMLMLLYEQKGKSKRQICE